MNKQFQNIWPFKKQFIWVVSLSVLYLLATSLLLGLRPEHILIIGLYNLCFFIGQKTRKIILAFTIFLIFGILYDLMKVYPNYLINQVDISSLYHFEQKIFGINAGGVVLTPSEFFSLHHSSCIDFICGLFYINWMPVPLAFAVYLYITNKRQYLDFALTFFLVNLLGFCIYYIHPAAPPWYVNQYGFDLHLGVQGNNAGLVRFDKLVHIPVFESIYSRNSNVFAALPSLHSAYPVVVLYYGIKNKLGWINGLLILFMTGIWFTAVYSGHHYVTDVLCGIICAIAGIILFQKLFLNIKVINNYITLYEKAIT